MANVEFKDFNFKLAVIEQLMYENDFITPEFRIEDHVDIEKVGYQPIELSIDYFKNFNLTPEVLKKVTFLRFEIPLDIQFEIWPFYDGEDDYFLIRSWEEVSYLPNLTKVRIFEEEDISEENAALLKSRGIKLEFDVPRSS